MKEFFLSDFKILCDTRAEQETRYKSYWNYLAYECRCIEKDDNAFCDKIPSKEKIRLKYNIKKLFPASLIKEATELVEHLSVY